MLQFQPQEHLMHSYIVASQSEQARDRLSLDLAAAMLCRSDGVRPCRTCRDCRKVYDGVHPDVIYVAPDPDAKVPTIKVDQIRSIAATAYILPSEAEKKVYVLRQADTMNLSAQNAFLKLLEEPPQAVRTADADAMPAAHRKLRREIMFMVFIAVAPSLERAACKIKTRSTCGTGFCSHITKRPCPCVFIHKDRVEKFESAVPPCLPCSLSS